MNKKKSPAMQGVMTDMKENTSRTPSFLTKVRNLLASAASLELQVILGLIKGELRKEFAHAMLKILGEIIKGLLSRS